MNNTGFAKLNQQKHYLAIFYSYLTDTVSARGQVDIVVYTDHKKSFDAVYHRKIITTKFKLKNSKCNLFYEFFYSSSKVRKNGI